MRVLLAERVDSPTSSKSGDMSMSSGISSMTPADDSLLATPQMAMPHTVGVTSPSNPGLGSAPSASFVGDTSLPQLTKSSEYFHIFVLYILYNCNLRFVFSLL